jgi:hypothetical protein
MTNAIGGVDSTSTFASTSATSFRDRMQTAMQPVADKLGMSEDDLKSELRGGKSLSDVANEQGVSRDDLLAAIKQGLQDANDSSTTSTDATSAATDATQLDAMANKIADHKHGGGHHHHHHGAPPAGATDGTSGQSAALGLLQQAGFDPQQLIQQLQSGAISSDTADKFGISAQSYASLLNGQTVDVQA